MSKREINLLTDTELDSIYAQPEFNEVEQGLYFDFDANALAAANEYRTIKARVSFLLTLGYFKAKQQFYCPDLTNSDDGAYLLQTYFPDFDGNLGGKIDVRVYRLQRAKILKQYGYKECNGESAARAKSQLIKLLRYHPKPHSALRQLLVYFESHHTILPSYRKLQDMFTEAFKEEEKRLDRLLDELPEQIQIQLISLIQRDDGLSQLNNIRSDQKDFQYTAVKTEVEKAQRIADLYVFSKSFIPRLKLSNNAVQYYAEIAEQYASSRLRKLKKSQQWLHLICFVHFRYQQIMDNLITSFMHHTKAIMNSAKTYADLALMEYSSKMVVDFPKLAQFLKWFPHRDKTLNHEELNRMAFNILPQSQFSALAEFLEGSTFDKKDAKRQFYLDSSRFLALYLRPILLTVDFEYFKPDNLITTLMALIKTHYASGKTPAQLKFSDDLGLTIPKHEISYLKRKPSDELLDPYLLEFFVYQKMYHHVDRGRLFCNDSITYSDIDQDLVDDALVDQAYEIAADYGYNKITIYCDERLNAALSELDEAWQRTNQRIDNGENSSINVIDSKDAMQWTLLYDASEKLDDSFFKGLPKVEIADLMMFIGEIISMWDGFAHIKGRYLKRIKPVALAVNACILSEAFGFGHSKMADMCDLGFNLLRSTREDFIRVDTLCAVNDIVSNFIGSLPIFKRWNLLTDKLLADADGQKFATSNSTIQSRYSKKYLGKGKGISLYTLIANFVAVNAKNIGLNEYEGHSLYDMIYSNKTDIDIDMVTGDGHSLNQLNFVALDAINVEYVPSIKNIREATEELYCTENTKTMSGLFQPKGKINVERIKSEKRGIIRVLLSLIMQENTQSNIIRKLNSHARYARLKAALFEYNKILKSTHVLNLIDNMSLRKAIRTARNRTESYHQLQSLIRKVYNGIFKGKKVVDNRVSAHAARLVANCIVAYNSIILNQIYEKMLQSEAAAQALDGFARISPIAWTHILFTGRYNFKKSAGNIDIAAMVKVLEQQVRDRY
ncbi:Tn3 family transposase [Thiotrichales bacterium 19S9-12]|nr:Tn3 family transposase [Thiotrichales bacterium 19S9-11]MCF6812404.1 Tn3 family transposase [Thiotrichales bacterium 19S9-12]